MALVQALKKRLAGEETGSALVLALAFLMVLSIVIGVLLSFTDTSFTLTASVRAREARVYALDGAVDAAINSIRTNPEQGRDPTYVPGATCTPAYPATINGVAVSVTCEPRSGRESGRPLAGTGNTSANTPEFAMLALARDTAGNLLPTEGISVQTNQLIAKGGVHSNGRIVTSGGPTGGASLDVRGSSGLMGTGPASAVGTCPPPGSLFANPIECAGAPYNNPAPAKADPAYPLGASVPTTNRDADLVDGSGNPDCPPGLQWVKQLQPGVYTNAAALSALTRCKAGLVLHFTPGTYLFNFNNGSLCGASSSGSASCTWTIDSASTSNHVQVVGGTPRGWSPGASTRPTPFPFPGYQADDPSTFDIDESQQGACVRPEDVPDGSSASGVRFVFAGESRLVVKTGQMELCPTTSTTSQQIVIYGLATPVAGGSSQTSTLNSASAPLAPQSSGSPAWSNLAAAADFDPAATACTSTTCASTGGTGNGWGPSVATLRNVTSSAAIPAGAQIDSAVLTVGHVESRNGSQGNISSQFSALRAGVISASTTVECAVAPTESYRRDTCSLAGLNTPDLVNGITAFRYTAQANGNRNPTAQLRGMRLVVTWSMPGIPAQSGCIVATIASGSACPLITWSGTGSNTDAAFQGTVYTPGAWLDVAVNNDSLQQFARGAIARNFTVHVTASASNKGAFSLPSGGTGGRRDRVVVFKAFADGAAQPQLISVVVFRDCPATGPCNSLTLNPGNRVTIERWSVR